jgi:xanthine dehydrogenase accessory factor
MNHWKESAEILSRLAELMEAGRRAALATVVDIVGSAYRRPGAKFLVEDAGGTLGSVSGGCLEADVREVAMGVLESGTPSLRHYNTGDEDPVFGLGLGCNGLVDIFVQPATAGPLAKLAGGLRERLAGDGPFALATILTGDDAGATAAIDLREPDKRRLEDDGDRGGGPDSVMREIARQLRAPLAAGRSGLRVVSDSPWGAPTGVHEVAGRKVFLEVLAPPPHLVVCGGGDDARPLVAYAADAGFRVSLFDHRPALLAPEWFPQAARREVARPEDPQVVLPPAERSLAVVKTHSLAHDRAWVRRLLAAGLPYVGVLGPRARTDSILREVLAGQPLTGDERERVFGPVGLDLGADGPRQVAISIVAELLAFTARREPRHLSERPEAIHAG